VERPQRSEDERPPKARGWRHNGGKVGGPGGRGPGRHRRGLRLAGVWCLCVRVFVWADFAVRCPAAVAACVGWWPGGRASCGGGGRRCLRGGTPLSFSPWAAWPGAAVRCRFAVALGRGGAASASGRGGRQAQRREGWARRVSCSILLSVGRGRWGIGAGRVARSLDSAVGCGHGAGRGLGGRGHRRRGLVSQGAIGRPVGGDDAGEWCLEGFLLCLRCCLLRWRAGARSALRRGSGQAFGVWLAGAGWVPPGAWSEQGSKGAEAQGSNLGQRHAHEDHLRGPSSKKALLSVP
jgi:hypothetical protein